MRMHEYIGPVPCEKKSLLFIFKLVFMSAIIYTSVVGFRSQNYVGCECGVLLSSIERVFIYSIIYMVIVH